VRVGGVLREDGDAEARGDGRVAPEDADVRDRRADALGHLDDRFAVGVGQQHDELLAAVATDEVALAHRRLQGDTDGRQHLVADPVAERVVDVLEVVEVQ
jgi:hypothetical protein